jgi:hypothetical protein
MTEIKYGDFLGLPDEPEFHPVPKEKATEIPKSLPEPAKETEETDPVKLIKSYGDRTKKGGDSND